MPRIPQIVQNQPLQTSGLSIGSAMAPAEAAARVGQEATNIGLELAHRQVELQRSQRVMEKTSQGAEAAAKLYDQILNDPSVPNDQVAQRVQDGFKILHDNIGADIKDSQVRQHFDQDFSSITESHVIHAIGVQRERINSSAKVALDESNDKMMQLAVDGSGPDQDWAVAKIHGYINSAVANKLLTPEQGQKELDARIKEIQYAKDLKLIRNDPDAAYKTIQSESYDNPVLKQELLDKAVEQSVALRRQEAADNRQALADAAKLRNDSIETDATQARLSALDGKLTHQALTELVQKYNQPGQKPFPATEAEHLFDLINKPLQQTPSDPNVLKSTELAVTSVNPQITKLGLANLYRKGSLNLDDYTALDNKLTANMHYLADQAKSDVRQRQSQAEAVLRANFGGDSAVLALALKDMAEGSMAQGGTQDPLKLLPLIQEHYKPLMQALGGSSKAAALGQFNSSRTAYANALTAQTKWSSGIRGTIADTFLTNPNDILVEQRKEDLLNKAKAAGKILRPAAKGVTDGTAWIQPDGVHVMAVGGEVLAQ